MNLRKKISSGMMLAGVSGVIMTAGYTVYHDKIDRNLTDEIYKVESIRNNRNMLMQLDKKNFSEEYIKATEQEIQKLDERYFSESVKNNLPYLKQQQSKLKSLELIECAGFLISFGLLVTGLAKKFPED